MRGPQVACAHLVNALLALEPELFDQLLSVVEVNDQERVAGEWNRMLYGTTINIHPEVEATEEAPVIAVEASSSVPTATIQEAIPAAAIPFPAEAVTDLNIIPAVEGAIETPTEADVPAITTPTPVIRAPTPETTAVPATLPEVYVDTVAQSDPYVSALSTPPSVSSPSSSSDSSSSEPSSSSSSSSSSESEEEKDPIGASPTKESMVDNVISHHHLSSSTWSKPEAPTDQASSDDERVLQSDEEDPDAHRGSFNPALRMFAPQMLGDDSSDEEMEEPDIPADKTISSITSLLEVPPMVGGGGTFGIPHIEPSPSPMLGQKEASPPAPEESWIISPTKSFPVVPEINEVTMNSPDEAVNEREEQEEEAAHASDRGSTVAFDSGNDSDTEDNDGADDDDASMVDAFSYENYEYISGEGTPALEKVDAPTPTTSDSVSIDALVAAIKESRNNSTAPTPAVSDGETMTTATAAEEEESSDLDSTPSHSDKETSDEEYAADLQVLKRAAALSQESPILSATHISDSPTLTSAGLEEEDEEALLNGISDVSSDTSDTSDSESSSDSSSDSDSSSVDSTFEHNSSESEEEAPVNRRKRAAAAVVAEQEAAKKRSRQLDLLTSLSAPIRSRGPSLSEMAAMLESDPSGQALNFHIPLPSLPTDVAPVHTPSHSHTSARSVQSRYSDSESSDISSSSDEEDAPVLFRVGGKDEKRKAAPRKIHKATPTGISALARYRPRRTGR